MEKILRRDFRSFKRKLVCLFVVLSLLAPGVLASPETGTDGVGPNTVHASFIVDIVGEIAKPFLGSLQTWFCWLLNEITEQLVDALVAIIGALPDHTMDWETAQPYIDGLWYFNEAFPIVEWFGLQSAYFLFKFLWMGVEWVVTLIPTVG